MNFFNYNHSVFEKNLTKKRISGYRSVLGLKEDVVNDETVVGIYMSIQSLVSHLYAPLHFFEVVLRNRMNDGFVEDYGDFWYAKAEINIDTHNVIKKTHDDLKRKVNNKEITNDELVCEITLGVWVNILSKSNRKEKNISAYWTANRGKVFEGAKEDKIGLIKGKFDNICRIRNRLMHHEPVWKNSSMTGSFFNKTLIDKYSMVCNQILDVFDEIIKAINICSPKISSEIAVFYRKNLAEEIQKQKENCFFLK